MSCNLHWGGTGSSFEARELLNGRVAGGAGRSRQGRAHNTMSCNRHRGGTGSSLEACELLDGRAAGGAGRGR
eukprot:10758011-Alexandrium_andersonii.AAC.1